MTGPKASYTTVRNLRPSLVEIDANQTTVTRAEKLYAAGRISIVDGRVRGRTPRTSWTAGRRAAMEAGPRTTGARRTALYAVRNYLPLPIKVVRPYPFPFS